MTVLEALAASLQAITLDPRDEAGVALAAKLAQEIDAAEEPKIIGDLSTRLLAVLNALGLTPASRAGVKGAVTDDNSVTPSSVLDELRARRKG